MLSVKDLSILTPVLRVTHNAVFGIEFQLSSTAKEMRCLKALDGEEILAM